MASDNNLIRIVGVNAVISSVGASEGTGLVVSDKDWESNNERLNGARDGLASSTNYNTAIRQVSLMARTLAEILITRGITEKVGADANVTGSTPEDVLEGKVTKYANQFNADNFLKDSEILNKHLSPQSVTGGVDATSKIAADTITSYNLGNIITNGSPGQSNGITISLFQNGSKNGLNLSISTDASKTNAHKIDVQSDADSKKYIISRKTTSGYDTQFIDANIYSQGSILYANTFKTNGTDGYVEASYFNATSDKRLKEDIRFTNVDALRILNNIDIYEYNFKGKSERQIGIMAQDLQCNDSNNFFITEKEDGYLAVKENKIIYLLWKAIQELSLKVEHLQNKENK